MKHKSGFLSLIPPSFLFFPFCFEGNYNFQTQGSHHEAESVNRVPGKKRLMHQLACGTREVIILSKVP